jgi:hypothetical protein
MMNVIFVFATLLMVSLTGGDEVIEGKETRLDYTFTTWGLARGEGSTSHSIQIAYFSNRGVWGFRNGSEIGDFTMYEVDQDYHCLISPAFSLSIPKKGFLNEQEWRCGDVHFKLVGNGEIEILGMALPYVQIESDATRGPKIVLYSQRAGLIGFAFRTDFNAVPFYELYLLQQSIGPLADEAAGFLGGVLR